MLANLSAQHLILSRMFLLFSIVDGLQDGISANYFNFLNEAISKAKDYLDR